MSRKDYVKLAAALRETNASAATIAAVAAVLKADNPRFDRDRFEYAVIGEPVAIRRAA